MSDDDPGDTPWRDWFEANRALLETAYLRGQSPWQQSGFGPRTSRRPRDWEALRRPVMDALLASLPAERPARPLDLLDIGCANGYLLECCVGWARAAGVALNPWGLDLSAPLVALARERLPANADQMAVGNAWTWTPPRRFDAVRTELIYVPEPLRRQFIQRLLDVFLVDGGVLLAAEYAGHTPDGEVAALSIDETVRAWGFAVEAVHSGVHDGVERTRVAVIRRVAERA